MKLVVGFTRFMSIALQECGSDTTTFADLVDVWNREEQAIRDLDEEQLRRDLVCP